MEECFVQSSGRKLLQYIFTMPAILTSVVLILCLLDSSPTRAASPFLLLLLAFSLMSALMALVYGGRFVKIQSEGPLLWIYKPYALFNQEQHLDLSTVHRVYLSGIRVQERYLSFYSGRPDEGALLTVYLVPFTEADLAIFSRFLLGRGIEAKF